MSEVEESRAIPIFERTQEKEIFYSNRNCRKEKSGWLSYSYKETLFWEKVINCDLKNVFGFISRIYSHFDLSR